MIYYIFEDKIFKKYAVRDYHYNLWLFQRAVKSFCFEESYNSPITSTDLGFVNWVFPLLPVSYNNIVHTLKSKV